MKVMQASHSKQGEIEFGYVCDSRLYYKTLNAMTQKTEHVQYQTL